MGYDNGGVDERSWRQSDLKASEGQGFGKGYSKAKKEMGVKMEALAIENEMLRNKLERAYQRLDDILDVFRKPIHHGYEISLDQKRVDCGTYYLINYREE